MLIIISGTIFYGWQTNFYWQSKSQQLKIYVEKEAVLSSSVFHGNRSRLRIPIDMMMWTKENIIVAACGLSSSYSFHSLSSSVFSPLLSFTLWYWQINNAVYCLIRGISRQTTCTLQNKWICLRETESEKEIENGRGIHRCTKLQNDVGEKYYFFFSYYTFYKGVLSCRWISTPSRYDVTVNWVENLFGVNFGREHGKRPKQKWKRKLRMQGIETRQW